MQSPASIRSQAPDGAQPSISGASGADRVVLVHCSASSARQWDGLVAQLAGFEPIAVDLYGHGKRPRWHGSGALTLAHEAAIIWNACPEGEPFHLVGHSYGGAVALRFALGFPERVRSLTLFEPTCFHLLTGEAHARGLAEIHAVAGSFNCALLCGDYRGAAEIFIDYWGGTGSWNALPEERKGRFADLTVCVAHHFWSLIREKTTLAACIEVAAPTLVLSGAESPGPARLIAKMLADTIPQARHRVIDGVGHMAPITHPTLVDPLVLEHLRQHGARDRRSFGSRGFVSITGAAVRVL